MPESGPHEAYLSRVLDELQGIHADVVADVAQADAVEGDAVERLEAVYTPAAAAERVSGLRNVLALGEMDRRVGERGATVRELLVERDGCVLVEARIDFPGAGLDEGTSAVVELRHEGATPAPNPTGWKISREELRIDGAPVEGCAAG